MLEEEAVTVLVCYEGARVFYRINVGAQATRLHAINNTSSFVLCAGVDAAFLFAAGFVCAWRICSPAAGCGLMSGSDLDMFAPSYDDRHNVST